MKMMNVGRVCMKIAGRDAGQLCVIINEIDDSFVLIDGQTRRRKCNVKHLEPVDTLLDIKKDASTDEVIKAFKTLNVEVKKTSPKKSTKRPKKQKIKKEKQPKQTKEMKKASKKTESTKKLAKKEETKETEAEKEVKKELSGGKKEN
ncbi:50S ribosomal protein L14e [Candidatus Woesearchaeota archaeon]|nr:50S ribosomal protein L14e [Candidatus Woesearchaeota archaeon]